MLIFWCVGSCACRGGEEEEEEEEEDYEMSSAASSDDERTDASVRVCCITLQHTAPHCNTLQ